MAVMMTKGCQARCQGKTEKDNNGSAGIALRKRHWHGAGRNHTGVCHQDDEERLVRMTSETGQDAKGQDARLDACKLQNGLRNGITRTDAGKHGMFWVLWRPEQDVEAAL